MELHINAGEDFSALPPQALFYSTPPEKRKKAKKKDSMKFGVHGCCI